MSTAADHETEAEPPQRSPGDARSPRTARPASPAASALEDMVILDLLARHALPADDLHARHRTTARGDLRADRHRASAFGPRDPDPVRRRPRGRGVGRRARPGRLPRQLDAAQGLLRAPARSSRSARALAGKRAVDHRTAPRSSRSPEPTWRCSPTTASGLTASSIRWPTGPTRSVRDYLGRHRVPVNALHAKGYPSHRLRALHPPDRARRGRARRTLVVGDARAEGMRTARRLRRTAGSRRVGRFTRHRFRSPHERHPRPRPGTAPRCAARTHLDALEAESIHILREVAAECRNVALLFSGGKDSAVALRLASKAFFPERPSFVLLHVDTEHNFPEVIAFRDHAAERSGLNLVVRSVGDSIRSGRVRLRHPDEPRNPHQSVTLLDAIAEFGFDACIGGARRDEEKARAKERIFSFRDAVRPVGPEEPAPGTLVAVQRPRRARREHPRVPDLELDRARRLAVHRARSASSCRRSTSLIGARSCAVARRSFRSPR